MENNDRSGEFIPQNKTQNPVKPTGLTGSMNLPLEVFLETAKERVAQGDEGSARGIYLLVLKMDPANEAAITGLSNLTEDWVEKKELLETFLKKNPYSIAIAQLLRYVNSRLEQSSDLDDLVKSSTYLKEWESRENESWARLRSYNSPKPMPISKVGLILLQAGVITQEQLDNAVNLQSMLGKLGDHQLLGKILIDYGYVSAKQLEAAIRSQEQEYYGSI